MTSNIVGIVKELGKMSIPGLEAWLQTPQGRYVMAWERQSIDAQVVDVFGYNALQLGLPQYALLTQNRIPLRQTIADHGRVDVLCDLRQLPFSAHSIDLVVMPHVLEFHRHPHQILREVERILIPEGVLLISGFNPLSLWGARQRLLRRQGELFPWNGHYLSPLRLKDWLQLLGFEAERPHLGCYAPPCVSEGWLKRWQRLEGVGRRCWNFAGSVYLLRATKRVQGMRLITPKWKHSRPPTEALSVLSKKESEHER